MRRRKTIGYTLNMDAVRADPEGFRRCCAEFAQAARQQMEKPPAKPCGLEVWLTNEELAEHTGQSPV